jgi:uncharacterized membrane protein YfcA
MGPEAARALLLVGAGIVAGLCATVAGLASLVSYPVLLALGLSPLAANVTNTVSLVATGGGAALGSRPELSGQKRRLARFGIAAAAGGSAGAVLLLTTPAVAFETVVPYLVAGASVLVLLAPVLTTRHRVRGVQRSAGAPVPAESRVPVLFAVAAVAFYGGYFGAAGGVMTLALLTAVLPDPLPRVNALKNVLAIAANGTAAIGFAFFGPVDWAAAIPLGLGFFIGGRLGPAVVRRVPATGLRVVIAVLGLALAIHLWLAAPH